LKRIWLGILFVCLLGGFIYSTSVLSAPASTVRVTFINVGQGDAALIQDPNGFDILIDGGLPAAGPTVVAYLREQGVDALEVMVASHADNDHIGGLISVLAAEDIAVERVLYNGYQGQTTAWFNFETAVALASVTLEAAQFPMTYSWGETSAQVLNPDPGLVSPNTNDASVVILLEHAAVKYLFTGDIPARIEATLAARGVIPQVQVLKVAHHGSDTSSSDLFLQSARPEQAVISVGVNSYGHPGSETLARLAAAGAAVWRTDRSGHILVASDGASYTLIPQLIYDLLYLPFLVGKLPLPEPSLEPPCLDPRWRLRIFFIKAWRSARRMSMSRSKTEARRLSICKAGHSGMKLKPFLFFQTIGWRLERSAGSIPTRTTLSGAVFLMESFSHLE
jgi:competence protein ComEC